MSLLRKAVLTSSINRTSIHCPLFPMHVLTKRQRRKATPSSGTVKSSHTEQQQPGNLCCCGSTLLIPRHCNPKVEQLYTRIYCQILLLSKR
mmetsp:Transcript_6882/g.41983  ORF Transcript_6882/g.41983 Transcript_6882/m.41983 type:complete len:91 (+) Transcript_6882:1466-1738(+)